ncbi:hypothetical protein CWE15_08995 [Aliidiomarina taiwanensis]|uniref:diguanylate cyclase n=1 Tax=Aliidiomarina taiwanensis TaxID=946228 RepID=A0A432X160_9GAMM|nr:GGDEF domain-containing protein [Aliidiomarina taiwanensis]RUO39878.1 hypothetical protein CWE15_08995 [Aliidiomarina taiwanensis]
MKFWRKYHPNIGKDDPEYHQAGLLYSILLVFFGVFGLTAILNITVIDAPHIAVFDFAGFILTGLLYFYVSRRGDFALARWLVVSVLALLLMTFAYLSQGSNYSFLWVSVFPPIAFFLLGPQAGAWFTTGVLVCSATMLKGFLESGISGELTLGAFLNFIEVGVAQILLLRHYETSRRMAYTRLEKLSVTDPLTSLHNRLHIDKKLEDLLSSSRAHDQHTSVLLLDIDNFKAINDEEGHLIGDKVLQALAGLLTSMVREQDIVGRWGGEEFLLVCPNTSLSEVTQLADRIIHALNEKPLVNNRKVTVSMGAAVVNESVETMEKLIQLADDRLYQAKKAGKNCLVAG